MEIQTSRFGRMTVDDQRVMTFARGLLGFPNHSRFALIQTGEENYFFWLQSIDDPIGGVPGQSACCLNCKQKCQRFALGERKWRLLWMKPFSRP